ncbi:hypothetical protein [Streptomyces sp. NPDC017260]|uniref:hypothetical protein n=1 Tax=unclassified Streptomyces TaxID=2593676 RepID=UPI0037AB1D4C
MGDFVVHGLDILRGSVGVSDSSGAISAVCTVCKPGPLVEPRFVAHAIRAQAESGYTKAMARGIREGGADFRRWATLAELPVPVPPLEYQRKALAFIDRETSQIDTLIDEQQQLVQMLKQRIFSFTDQCFYGTTGKRTVLLKRVLRRVDRPPIPGLGVVTAYRDGEVTLRSNRREEGYTFSEREEGYQEIRPGDLVFHGLDGFSGAVGISDSHGNATPVYHACEAIAGDEPEYVALLLRYLGTSGFLATQAPNVRQRAVDFRNWATFGRIPLSLPDPSTQRAVVRDIREQTTRTEILIGESERLIELSQERRAALITAAVTGEIEALGDD